MSIDGLQSFYWVYAVMLSCLIDKIDCHSKENKFKFFGINCGDKEPMNIVLEGAELLYFPAVIYCFNIKFRNKSRWNEKL